MTTSMRMQDSEHIFYQIVDNISFLLIRGG